MTDGQFPLLEQEREPLQPIISSHTISKSEVDPNTTQLGNQDLVINIDIKAADGTIIKIMGVIDGLSSGGEDTIKAITNIRNTLQDIIIKTTSIPSISDTMEHFIRLSDKQIAKLNVGRDKRDAIGCAMSLGVMVSTPNNKQYMVTFHIGDTRIYRNRKSAGLEILTRDHHQRNLNQIAKLGGQGIHEKAEEIIRLQTLSAREPMLLTGRQEAEAEDYVKLGSSNTLVNFLGSGHVYIETDYYEINEGDKYIFTSDGATDNITHEELAGCINESSESTIANKVVEKAKKSAQSGYKNIFRIGAKPDDITSLSASFINVGRELHEDVNQLIKNIFQITDETERDTAIADTLRHDVDGVSLRMHLMNQGIAITESMIEKAIAEAQNMNELFNAIDFAGEIHGTNQGYTAETLKALIRDVNSNRSKLQFITSRLGLKRKVEQLLPPNEH